MWYHSVKSIPTLKRILVKCSNKKKFLSSNAQILRAPMTEPRKSHSFRRSIFCCLSSFFYMCLIPPMAEPFTCSQLMLSSRASSTNPTTQTLSPRTMYRPSGTSVEASSSSGVRITRSMVWPRTCGRRIVSLPRESRVYCEGTHQVCLLVTAQQISD